MNRQSNSTIQQENKNEYNELSNWATRQPRKQACTIKYDHFITLQRSLYTSNSLQLLQEKNYEFVFFFY